MCIHHGLRHHTLMPDLAILLQVLQFVVKDRTQLALENIALREQLAVY